MQLRQTAVKRMRVAGSLLAGMLLAGALGEVSAAPKAGEVTQVYGRATMASSDGNIRRIRKGSDVESGATINTGTGSFAKIKFKDGGSIFLRPSTRSRSGYSKRHLALSCRIRSF